MSDNLFQKIALLGTYHPAVPTFKMLAERNWVCIVIVPEKAGFRNDELLEIAEKYDVPWSYDIASIEQYDPIFILAANYPKIVPKKYLEKYICINTHWSLLPRWRGIHPTAWAVINNDEEIGLTVHMMDEEIDTGAVIAQESLPISKDFSLNQIHEELAKKQASCLVKLFAEYIQTLKFSQYDQNEVNATYIAKRKPEDGIINWEWPTERIYGLVKALPLPKYPGAFTFWGLNKITICKVKPADCPPYFCTPGQVVRIKQDGSAWVKTGDTCLEVQEVLFEDEKKVRKPAEVLKFGEKLGFDVQSEIPVIKKKIEELEKKIYKSCIK